MAQHLFVYGTLRRYSPHPLARRLQSGARHLGTARAAGRLYELGHYPGALFHPDDKARIVGDLFGLRHATRLLAELDRFEGIAEPEALFKRIAIEVRLDQGGAIEAWAYGLTAAPALARRIANGDFMLHGRLLRGDRVRS